MTVTDNLMIEMSNKIWQARILVYFVEPQTDMFIFILLYFDFYCVIYIPADHRTDPPRQPGWRAPVSPECPPRSQQYEQDRTSRCSGTVRFQLPGTCRRRQPAHRYRSRLPALLLQDAGGQCQRVRL